MRNGETRVVGVANIICSVHRSSWTLREDRWMGSMKPRHYSHRTFYRVVGPDGKTVAELIEGYKNAVRIAEGVK